MGDAITDEEYEKIKKDNPDGKEDEDGFFVFSDGSFIDPYGYKFDKDGYDSYGGYYDDYGYYVPGEEYADQYYEDYEYEETELIIDEELKQLDDDYEAPENVPQDLVEEAERMAKN